MACQGLVSDTEARELYHMYVSLLPLFTRRVAHTLAPYSFFSGCHVFIPVFDPSYDTYEGLMERSPWTFDAILAVAAKIRSGTGPLIPAFYKCLEEAQGIARSSLFGPVVRKEAVQGMLLLAAWSTNGWLPSGHAMRMALDLGLHRALEKLADDGGKQRSDEEERNLGEWIGCSPKVLLLTVNVWYSGLGAHLVVSVLVRPPDEPWHRTAHCPSG